MQRVLTIIAWLLVRCSLSSMPSAAVEQRRSEPFLDRTTVSAIDIILELEGAAQHRLAPTGDRKILVQGKSVSVLVIIRGPLRLLKNKKSIKSNLYKNDS